MRFYRNSGELSHIKMKPISILIQSTYISQRVSTLYYMSVESLKIRVRTIAGVLRVETTLSTIILYC